MKPPPRKLPYAGFDATERDHFGIRPETVLAMFRQGLDTAEIARRLPRSEAKVYALLAYAREAERAG